jgi:hypothetical protein
MRRHHTCTAVPTWRHTAGIQVAKVLAVTPALGLRCCVQESWAGTNNKTCVCTCCLPVAEVEPGLLGWAYFPVPVKAATNGESTPLLFWG